MSAFFTINFRREAYQREVARTRRHLLALGTWLAYFGLLAIVIGLYGLNCASVVRRAAQVERQASRLQAMGVRGDWQVRPDQIGAVERFKENPALWRDRLRRLVQILPPNAVLVSVAINPDNSGLPADQRRLVVTGQFRTPPGSDRMRPAVQLVSALRADTVFSRGYGTIRLTSSQAVGESGNQTAFEIECR